MADANTLTEKERIFAEEYIKTTNATQSAIKVRQYIDTVMNERSKNTIATADEVLEYLTKVMNGEEKDAFGLDASIADRTKAAELLGKRHMLFTEKVKLDAEIEIDISDRMKQARVKSDEVQQGTTD